MPLPPPPSPGEGMIRNNILEARSEEVLEKDTSSGPFWLHTRKKIYQK